MARIDDPIEAAKQQIPDRLQILSRRCWMCSSDLTIPWGTPNNSVTSALFLRWHKTAVRMIIDSHRIIARNRLFDNYSTTNYVDSLGKQQISRIKIPTLL